MRSAAFNRIGSEEPSPVSGTNSIKDEVFPVPTGIDGLDGFVVPGAEGEWKAELLTADGNEVYGVDCDTPEDARRALINAAHAYTRGKRGWELELREGFPQ